jgi:hypothetical protein
VEMDSDIDDPKLILTYESPRSAVRLPKAKRHDLPRRLVLWAAVLPWIISLGIGLWSTLALWWIKPRHMFEMWAFAVPMMVETSLLFAFPFVLLVTVFGVLHCTMRVWNRVLLLMLNHFFAFITAIAIANYLWSLR